MCLGLKINRQADGGYTLDQQHYLETVLAEFDMQSCKPSSTPMAKGEVHALITGSTGGKPLDTKQHHCYRQIIGNLMYIMVGSQPDLAHALSVLGRFCDAPNSTHLAMAHKVLAYVKGTINFKMHYKGSRGSNSIPALSGFGLRQLQRPQVHHRFLFPPGPQCHHLVLQEAKLHRNVNHRGRILRTL